MITKIDTNIPNKTNKRLIVLLSTIGGWGFGRDVRSLKITDDTPDAGFLLKTYSDNNQFTNNDSLNSFAYILTDIVEKNTFFNFKEVTRIYWNWYHPGSKTIFHHDEELDNYYSIIYNLHTNDGGTNFKINDKIDFYPSIESQALLFPSKLLHTGIAPKNKINRFVLNVVVRI